jgi:hypothetical protein
MTTKLVLDTSAVASYAKGSIHVGELLAELSDEQPDVRFGVPVLCLAEAGVVVGELSSLSLLASHDRAALKGVAAGDWLDLANLSILLGRVDCAATFLAATQNRAYLVTATPDRYPDSDVIIDIGQ